MGIKWCLNGLMVYQLAFNEDVCSAYLSKKHHYLSDSSTADLKQDLI